MNILIFIGLALVILLAVFLAWRFQPFGGCDCKSTLPRRFHRGALPRPIGTIRTQDLPSSVLVEINTLSPVGGGPTPPPPGMALPAAFDSRQKWPGQISNSLDQGSCGSCWAFSSATAISDRIRIKNPTDTNIGKTIVHTPFAVGESANILNSLNPYDLINCDICAVNQASHPQTTAFLASRGDCNQGCGGGVISYAYHYVKNQGIHTLGDDAPINCDPQGSVDCPCNVLADPSKKLYKISGVYSVIRGDTTDQEKQRSIQADIIMNGPVTIGYTVYQSFEDFFSSTPTGIYTSANQTAGDAMIGGHAVDIIGWGTDPQKGDYWLVRNSWGVNWGDGGVFRIQYNWGDFMSQAWGASV